MLTRGLIIAGCLLAGVVVLARASETEPVPIRQSFDTFPMTLGDWEGQRLPDFDQDVLKVLGVDEYLNRLYVSSTGVHVGLYVGYYQSQRQGDTMHSPLNCLPGAGWLPIAHARLHLPVTLGGQRREVPINNVLIEKGLDRQVVFYWYQGHDRVVASEYWGKVYTVLDAVRLNRTDGALVRVVVPVVSRDGGEAAAEAAATDFTRVLFAHLGGYLPS